MRSYFRLNSKVFDMNLTSNELAVYAYLCSISGTTTTLLGDLVKVKQITIAEKCGIAKAETVSRIVKKLMAAGLIQSVILTVKRDGNRGTNCYIINKLPCSKGYFKVDRNIFKTLNNAKLLRVYLFVCKCIDSKKGYCWNSYSDFAEQLHMNRGEVMSCLKMLAELKLLHKKNVYYDNGSFSDNHYRVRVIKLKKRIRKAYIKRRTVPLNHQEVQLKHKYYLRINDSMIIVLCQEEKQKWLYYFFCRGGYRKRRSCIRPICNNRKRNILYGKLSY